MIDATPFSNMNVLVLGAGFIGIQQALHLASLGANIDAVKRSMRSNDPNTELIQRVDQQVEMIPGAGKIALLAAPGDNLEERCMQFDAATVNFAGKFRYQNIGKYDLVIEATDNPATVEQHRRILGDFPSMAIAFNGGAKLDQSLFPFYAPIEGTDIDKDKARFSEGNATLMSCNSNTSGHVYAAMRRVDPKLLQMITRIETEYRRRMHDPFRPSEKNIARAKKGSWTEGLYHDDELLALHKSLQKVRDRTARRRLQEATYFHDLQTRITFAEDVSDQTIYAINDAFHTNPRTILGYVTESDHERLALRAREAGFAHGNIPGCIGYAARVFEDDRPEEKQIAFHMRTAQQGIVCPNASGYAAIRLLGMTPQQACEIADQGYHVGTNRPVQVKNGLEMLQENMRHESTREVA